CCASPTLRYYLSARLFFFLLIRRPPISTLFPYTTLFRSVYGHGLVTRRQLGFPLAIDGGRQVFPERGRAGILGRQARERGQISLLGLGIIGQAVEAVGLQQVGFQQQARRRCRLPGEDLAGAADHRREVLLLIIVLGGDVQHLRRALILGEGLHIPQPALLLARLPGLTLRRHQVRPGGGVLVIGQDWGVGGF